MDELSGLLIQRLQRRFGLPTKWETYAVEDGFHAVLASVSFSAQLVEDFANDLANQAQMGRPQQTSSLTQCCCAAGGSMSVARV